MQNAPQPKAPGGKLDLAPGVILVVSKNGPGNTYELVHQRMGFRQPLSQAEHAIVAMLRAGATLEDVTRRFPGDAGRRLYERLVGAGLLVQVAKTVTFLPDDVPRLAPGVRLQRSDKQGIVLCYPPHGGKPTEMREVEAVIAKAFDGTHTVVDIVEAARMRGIPATLQTMVSFLKELHGMGCLDAVEHTVNHPMPEFSEPEPQAPPEEPSEELPTVTGVEVDMQPVSETESNWGVATFLPDSVSPGANEMSIPSLKLEGLKSLSLDKEKPSGSPWKWIGVAAGVVVALGGGYVLSTHVSFHGSGHADGTPTAASTTAVAIATTAVVSTPPPSNGQRKVITVQPEGAAAGSTILAAGYVAPKDPITLGVTAGGRVMKVLVQNGDNVKKDQVLVQLDDSQTRAQMGLAWAKKKDAERVLERTKTLYASQAATSVDLDKATGAAEVARAEYAVYAQQLEQARIRSPIDKGTILDVLTHPGEVLTPSSGGDSGIVKLADLTKLVAEVDVNEADVFKLAAGTPADVVPDASPDKKYTGTVSEISQEADRSRGTVQVKIDLRVPDRSLRPGNSVKATFRPGTANRILVPKSALDQGGIWMVAPNGTVFRKAVTSRAAGPDMLEITQGLAVGDRVVADGVGGLRPGQKIE